MPAFFAFLHHVAAFAFVAALVLEFVLIKDELSVRTARKLLVADLVVGVSAGVVLVAGARSACSFTWNWPESSCCF
jgi:putative membrane protein